LVCRVRYLPACLCDLLRFVISIRRPASAILFPYTTLFRSSSMRSFGSSISARPIATICRSPPDILPARWERRSARRGNSSYTRSDRKSTRLNSSHVKISYAVFCLKKKTNDKTRQDEKQEQR